MYSFHILQAFFVIFTIFLYSLVTHALLWCHNGYLCVTQALWQWSGTVLVNMVNSSRLEAFSGWKDTRMFVFSQFCDIVIKWELISQFSVKVVAPLNGISPHPSLWLGSHHTPLLCPLHIKLMAHTVLMSKSVIWFFTATTIIYIDWIYGLGHLHHDSVCGSEISWIWLLR